MGWYSPPKNTPGLNKEAQQSIHGVRASCPHLDSLWLSASYPPSGPLIKT